MNSQIAKTENNKTRDDRKLYLKPNYELRKEESAYFVDVHMPGVSRDKVDITLNGDMLTIEASRIPYRHPDWKPLHTEIRENDYRLDLQLNVDIDQEGVSAKSDLGILTVRLPLAAKAAQRTIPVE